MASARSVPPSRFPEAAITTPVHRLSCSPLIKKIGVEIEAVFKRHRRRYGYRRIKDELEDLGIICAPSRVHRIMHERGLKALQPKTYVPRTSDGRAHAFALLGGIFVSNMPSMFARALKPPNQSFFLFGPRGTGKSTWIREHFSNAISYDLLNTGESLRLARDPRVLTREVSGAARGDWVVIDEIQKVPALLDEVHSLIETQGLRFVLSGSSARKLRRGASNLLAGRAIVEQMFPLVSAEAGWATLGNEPLAHGTLPIALTSDDPVAFLDAYAQTYLQEEIRAEALTRSIGAFSRFLEIAARQNGQVTNVAGLARDAAVSRQTVQNYFEILEDTLLGFWLRPWKLKSSTRQVGHPKFYLFDSGVARALSGRLPYPPSPEENGPLMETWILNEVRAYLAYRQLRYPIYYWRTHDGSEVDLFMETRDGFVAVEIKSSARWDNRFNRSLKSLKGFMENRPLRCFGVFLGERAAHWDDIEVLPARQFLDRLWSDQLL